VTKYFKQKKKLENDPKTFVVGSMVEIELSLIGRLNIFGQ
jgi:hypothetical protein